MRPSSSGWSSHRSYPRMYATTSPTIAPAAANANAFCVHAGTGRYSIESYRGVKASSDRGGSRTHDLRIKSPLLYQLSYPV